MLDEKICELRQKLNESIITGQDYSVTYKLSVELDELITEYYKSKKIKENAESKINEKHCMNSKDKNKDKN